MLGQNQSGLFNQISLDLYMNKYYRNSITKLRAWVLGHHRVAKCCCNRPQDALEATDREVLNICILLK